MASLEEKVNSLFRTEVIDFIVITPLFTGRYVNLDNAATTSAFKSVEDTVNDALIYYGSVHRGSGQKSRISSDMYEEARQIVREFVGASKENYVLFTKNTTESINHAAALFSTVKGKVLVSDIEHSSNLLPWIKNGEIIQYKTKLNGSVDLKSLENIFSHNKDIKLIAITGCSNVTGYKPPVYKIAEIAHKYGSKILVDVCQLIQHDKVDILPDDKPNHLDFITFSGHKMYAPFGAGVLVGPKSFFDEVLPYQIGGGNLVYITKDLELKRFKTEPSHDPGTPNAIGAIAIARSIMVFESLGYKSIAKHERNVVDKSYNRLKKIPNVKLYVKENKLGSIIPFDIAGMPHHLVAEILAQEYGIGVRAGAFCNYELMRKLKKIDNRQDKIIAEEIDRGITKSIPGLVRASFGLINNSDDVNRLVNAVSDISRKGFEHYLERYKEDQKTGRWSLIAYQNQ